MLDFYLQPQYLRFLISSLALAGWIIQIVYMMLRYYMPLGSKQKAAERLLEIFTLTLQTLLAFLPAIIADNISLENIAPLGFEKSLYLLFTLLLLFSAPCFERKGQLICLLSPLAAFFSLPFWQNSRFFIFTHTAALAILSLRSLYLALAQVHLIKNNLSELSIKEAVDTLPAGILFYKENGFLLLLNKTMQELAQILSTDKLRNGCTFFAKIASNSVENGQLIFVDENSYILELANNSYWRFKKDEIILGGKKYYHLAAFDITEEWRLTLEMRRQRKKLNKQKKQLLNMLNQLAKLSYHQELIRKKERVHDILGHKIAVVDALWRQETPDLDAIVSNLQNLEAELGQDMLADDELAQSSLLQIVSAFSSVGIRVKVHEPLPEDDVLAAFIDVIRESSTNAVRHGLATRIDINFSQRDNAHVVSISNNGSSPFIIKEGSGIQAIRRQLKSKGGQLKIISHPMFTVEAVLAKETTRI